jgi:hypothetical protein
MKKTTVSSIVSRRNHHDNSSGVCVFVVAVGRANDIDRNTLSFSKNDNDDECSSACISLPLFVSLDETDVVVPKIVKDFGYRRVAIVTA